MIAKPPTGPRRHSPTARLPWAAVVAVAVAVLGGTLASPITAACCGSGATGAASTDDSNPTIEQCALSLMLPGGPTSDPDRGRTAASGGVPFSSVPAAVVPAKPRIPLTLTPSPGDAGRRTDRGRRMRRAAGPSARSSRAEPTSSAKGAPDGHSGLTYRSVRRTPSSENWATRRVPLVLHIARTTCRTVTEFRRFARPRRETGWADPRAGSRPAHESSPIKWRRK